MIKSALDVGDAEVIGCGAAEVGESARVIVAAVDAADPEGAVQRFQQHRQQPWQRRIHAVRNRW